MTTPTATLPASAQPVTERGSKALSEGHYALSINEYTNALNIAPKYAPLYAQRAAAYLQLNQLPKALHDARAATDVDALWAGGWVRLGEVMRAIGDGETDPAGVGVLYGAVEEAYENAYELLRREGGGAMSQREGVERKLMEIREKLASI